MKETVEKMAALPSPTQVAGNHSAIYEHYYNLVDPNGFGTVGGMEAARFLKRSGLSDVMLSKIWDLSDPGGRGCLDKLGMFVALKLVALVQDSKDLTIANVVLDVPPPKMGDTPLPRPAKPPPPPSAAPVVAPPPALVASLPPSATSSTDWTIRAGEREKYDKLFASLGPINGMIPGAKVKIVLMESKLPLETLGKIWDLADQDKDGMLNQHEFIVAMHLVYKALENYSIPNVLPPELVLPAKRKASGANAPLLSLGLDGMKPDLQPVPVMAAAPPAAVKPAAVPQVQWVVTPDEKAKSDCLFVKSDVDKDGFVSGQEIKDVFLQSGVPQPVLAHIWALCDIKQSGKLNNEQFALAMWLVARCLQGVEPPPSLTAEMTPPSFRKSVDGLVENNNTRYSNPELDMVSKDLEVLVKEKLLLEADITQKEADIKIKSGEIKSLQSELDTLAATLKQLENQKGEAQKRLNDLRTQKSEIDAELDKTNEDIEGAVSSVDKLRVQAAEQAEAVAQQETELNSKKQQLEGLRQEEQKLEQQKVESDNKLQNLTSNLQDTQLGISQAKAMVTQLQEHSRQIKDAIDVCESALEGGTAASVPDTALRITPAFRDPSYTQVGLVNGNSNKHNGFSNDPFSSGQDAAFGGENLFKNDPFKSSNAFGDTTSDPFSSAFSNKPNSDGFATDPFGAESFDSVTKRDPFDAFGDSRKNSTTAAEPDKDPFGCDPFAVLHAPTRDGSAPPRPTSPSPALPPKKSKQPPPRPAPPRPAQPPAPATKKGSQPDLFGADAFAASGGGGFADFSDFDTKFSQPTTTQKPQPANNNKSTGKGLDFTDDPFRDYRYEDPFNINFDDEDDVQNNNNKPTTTKGGNNNNNPIIGNIGKSPDAFKFDPFGLTAPSKFSGGRGSAPLALSEDQQLAWAEAESVQLAKEQKMRQLQEEADLRLAISLSKENQKKKK